MEEKEFAIRPNFPVGIFLVMITLATAWNIIQAVIDKAYTTTEMAILVVFVLLMYYYFLGCRPYKYVITNKEIIQKKRLWKDSSFDLMHAEVISDPVPRLTQITTRPHGIEIYDDQQKRHSYWPKEQVEFTDAVLDENKRIHCTVKAYTDVHRNIKRRERRQSERKSRRRS